MSIAPPGMVERLATSASVMGLSLSRFSKTNLRTAFSRFLSLKTGASEDDSAENNGADESQQIKSIPVRLRKGIFISAVLVSWFGGYEQKSN